MMRAAAFALVLALCMTFTPAQAETPRRMLEFADLIGWEADDHSAALDAFIETCTSLDGPEWRALCGPAAAQAPASARRFFERFFRPVQIGTGPALFTGYYEPELTGSRTRNGRYAYPVYRRPPELEPGGNWHSRSEIEARGHLRGRGLELAWLDDPVDVFFLQIQGSGRIAFPDGTTTRLGFDGKNGHPYRSVGQELVRRGLFAAHQVSAQTIRDWVRANPHEGTLLLQVNPSFVFFREVGDIPPGRGPLGAMNRSVTAGRSIAVDPDFVPLGAPVWLEKAGASPMQRLMIAQDTGSAIKGAQRADIFYGTGASAGDIAGRIRDPGRMIVLLPIPQAFAMLSGAGP